MAGCTDPGFYSRACFRKPPEFHEQEWVAIFHCGEKTGKNQEWGGCKVDDNSTELIVLPLSSCTPYCSSPVYVGATNIPAFASLPTRAGGSIKWTSGFDPATRVASAPESVPPTTTTSMSSAVTVTPPPTTVSMPSAATVTPSPMATPALVPGEDNGLSTGAMAGIGVGAAGAVLLLVAVVLLALLVRRRRRTSAETAENSQNQDDMGPEQTRHHSESQKQPWGPQLFDASPYTAYKAELPAEERRAYQAELPAEGNQAYHAELPAEENGVYQTELPVNPNIMLGGGSDVAVVVDRLSPHASPNPSSLTAYSPYLSYSGASPSPAASPGPVSPQMTGEQNRH